MSKVGIEEDTILSTVEEVIMENRIKKANMIEKPNKDLTVTALTDKTIKDISDTAFRMFRGNEKLFGEILIKGIFDVYENHKTEKHQAFIKLIKALENTQNSKIEEMQNPKFYETKEFLDIETQKLDNLVFELKEFMLDNIKIKFLIKSSIEFLSNKVRRLTESETSDINLLFENMKIPESTIKVFFEQFNMLLKKIKNTKFESEFYHEKKITIFKDNKKVNLESINSKSSLIECLFNNYNTLGIFFWLLYIGQTDLAINLINEYKIYVFCEETLNEQKSFLKTDSENDISFWHHKFINLYGLVEFCNLEKIKKSVINSNKYDDICESLKNSFLSRQDKKFLKLLEKSLMIKTYIDSFEEEQRDVFVEDFKIWMNSQ